MLSVRKGGFFFAFGLLSAQGQVPLPAPADLLAVDALYHVYLWSQAEQALYKLWAPQYDSLSRIGGPVGPEGFLGLTSLAPVGNQQLYVLDAAGQKIFLLGTNLQPLQTLAYTQLPSEIAEGYPSLLAVRSGGELYLLLRETQEVVKVDFFGRVLVRFGGKVFGPGQLLSVSRMQAGDSYLYLTDTLRREIVVYDTWGSFVKAIPFPSQAKDALGFAEGQVFWGDTLGWWKPQEGELRSFTFPVAPKAVWVQRERLYWVADRTLGWMSLP